MYSFIMFTALVPISQTAINTPQADSNKVEYTQGLCVINDDDDNIIDVTSIEGFNP